MFCKGGWEAYFLKCFKGELSAYDNEQCQNLQKYNRLYVNGIHLWPNNYIAFI
jgi:hypothetical protein